MNPALRPIILDKMVPEFIATAFGGNSRRLPGLELKALLKGEKPRQMGVGIESQIDTLMSYFEAAGVTNYSWHTFGPGMKTAMWSYYSFVAVVSRPRGCAANKHESNYRDQS